MLKQTTQILAILLSLLIATSSPGYQYTEPGTGGGGDRGADISRRHVHGSGRRCRLLAQPKRAADGIFSHAGR